MLLLKTALTKLIDLLVAVTLSLFLVCTLLIADNIWHSISKIF